MSNVFEHSNDSLTTALAKAIRAIIWDQTGHHDVDVTTLEMEVEVNILPLLKEWVKKQ